MRKQVTKLKESNSNVDCLFQEHSNEKTMELSLQGDGSDFEGNDGAGPYRKGKGFKDGNRTKLTIRHKVNKIQQGTVINRKSTDPGVRFFHCCL